MNFYNFFFFWEETFLLVNLKKKIFPNDPQASPANLFFPTLFTEAQRPTRIDEF